MAISMVSAAPGLAVGSNNAIARRGMHLRFIKAGIRIATTVAKLACLMASSSFSLARRAPFDGLPGFRDYWPRVCCAANQEWQPRLLVAQNHPLRIFSAVAQKNAYSLGSERYPPPRISERASRRRTMICDFRHATTPC